MKEYKVVGADFKDELEKELEIHTQSGWEVIGFSHTTNRTFQGFNKKQQPYHYSALMLRDESYREE